MSPPGRPALTQQLLDALAAFRFKTAGDIDDFFQKRKSKPYIAWFNEKLAGKAPWESLSLVDSRQNDIGFHRFWNQIGLLYGVPGISVVQFTALMSILSNEVRGNFAPAAEKLGRAGHPGLAYAFNRIDGVKKSYNTLSGNKTAFECFNNPGFIAAHGGLPLGAQLARTSDTRWNGEVYPSGFATAPRLQTAGFLMQADFMKFRGRGFIQTTGRMGYIALIDFIQAYKGENSTIDFYRTKWKDKSPVEIAYESTNEDWDALFQQTDLIVACEAVRAHNQDAGNYLALAPAAAALNGAGAGSLFNMGKRIGGADRYAELFAARVAAVVAAI